MWHCSVRDVKRLIRRREEIYPQKPSNRERIALREGAPADQTLYMTETNRDEKSSRARKSWSPRLPLMAHTDSSQSPQQDAQETPTSDKSIEQATLIGTLAHLWPYIWPSDRTDLKMRVVWSVVLLLIAKLATLSVPFTFKWAT